MTEPEEGETKARIDSSKLKEKKGKETGKKLAQVVNNGCC